MRPSHYQLQSERLHSADELPDRSGVHQPTDMLQGAASKSVTYVTPACERHGELKDRSKELLLL
jgi:hypothetical protein